MSNQTKVFKTFKEMISKTCIKQIDGEWRVIGKHCEIVPLGDGQFDLWLRASKQKITFTLKALPAEWSFTIATDEAWTTDATLEGILANLRTLGIRRKRTLAPEARAKASERLAKARNAHKRARV